MSTLRDASHRAWTSGSPANLEQINAGSLQRIADAVEVMSESHAALIEERDRFKRWLHEEQERRRSLERRLSATQGVVTRLKRKLAEVQGE